MRYARSIYGSSASFLEAIRRERYPLADVTLGSIPMVNLVTAAAAAATYETDLAAYVSSFSPARVDSRRALLQIVLYFADDASRR